jgi:hypothetical protein
MTKFHIFERNYLLYSKIGRKRRYTSLLITIFYFFCDREKSDFESRKLGNLSQKQCIQNKMGASKAYLLISFLELT